MTLSKDDIEMIKATVHETYQFSPRTKLNELLLQSGVTILGFGILSLMVSIIAWGIVRIWNRIL